MEDERWLFEKNQGNSRLKIKLLYGTTSISERKFKRDMKSLTDRLSINDWNDGENGVVSITASYGGRVKGMRHYDLEPNFKEANITLDSECKKFGREKLISSNRCETQFTIGNKYFSIYLLNPNED